MREEINRFKALGYLGRQQRPPSWGCLRGLASSESDKSFRVGQVIFWIRHVSKPVQFTPLSARERSLKEHARGESLFSPKWCGPSSAERHPVRWPGQPTSSRSVCRSGNESPDTELLTYCTIW